jgi:hypothetical protein
MHDQLRERARLLAGRTAIPTAAIINSQSVKAAEEVARAIAAMTWGRKSTGPQAAHRRRRLRPADRPDVHWTKGYIRFCSPHRGDLEEWALGIVGGGVTLCPNLPWLILVGETDPAEAWGRPAGAPPGDW